MLLLLGFLLYFVPIAIAMFRGHGNCGAIFVLNLLLGWTFIGWVIALVWSVTATHNVPISKEDAAEAAKENIKGWRTAGIALFIGCAISLIASPFLPKDAAKKVDPVPKRFVIDDVSSPDAMSTPEQTPVSYETPVTYLAPTPAPTPTPTPHHKRHHSR